VTTPNPEPQRKLIRVGRPAIRGTLRLEPVVPIDGPVTTGPLIHVRRPVVRGTLTFEPVVTTEVELPLPGGADGGPMFETIHAVLGKLNEIEAQLGRPGVCVDGERSGVRDGKVVLVVTPNDPAGAVETCKRIADFLFAAVRTVPGVTVKVFSAESPDKPIYELAA